MNAQNEYVEISGFLDENLEKQTTPDIKGKVLTYGRLSQLHQPSAEEEAQLNEILQEAIEDSLLNFWIEHVEHILAHHYGLLTDEARDSYQKQAAALKEKLRRLPCQVPGMEAVSEHPEAHLSSDQSSADSVNHQHYSLHSEVTELEADSNELSSNENKPITC